MEPAPDPAADPPRAKGSGNAPIDATELAARIAEGEGTRTEFKQGLPRAEKVARTLAAFANTRGGLFLVGVGDRGEILGAPKPAETLEELAAIAAHSVEPGLAPRVGRVDLKGLPVVVALVPRSPDRPHAARLESGELEVTVRLGSSTRSADARALAAMRSGDSQASLSDLERRALVWVAAQGDAGTSAQGRATSEAFARAVNIGRSRSRRLFVKLERSGHLIGAGSGSQRTFSVP